jgi:hypothetical protein
MFGEIEKNIKNSKKELIFIFIIGVIFYINEIISERELYKNCKNPHVSQLYLFLHHLMSSFLIFGWILTRNKFLLKIHIILVIILLTGQYIYKGDCPITHKINKNCNIPNDFILKDFMFMAGIKSNSYIYIYYLFIIISVIVAYRKITN